MKKIYTILMLLLLQQFVFAQTTQPPQGISYQAVAYNSSSAPVVNQNISVRITIRNSTATGAIVYRETFPSASFPTVPTNNQGIFNINIGQGTPTTGTFASINWAVNKKFVQVEIDPLAGTSYVSVGTTELMSVPYALYAGGSKSMQVVNDIAELRTKVGEEGDIIYVRYHSISGDQGGGHFRWRTDAVFLDTSTYFGTDNKGTLIKATASNAGRWVRQYDGYINMTFFGATYNNSNQALQAAIDFAYNNHLDGAPTRGTTVFIPNGAWLIDTINLKTGVDIIGDSEDFTILYAKTTSEQGTTAYMFEAPAGVFKTSMSNLKIIGDRDGVPVKGCFHFKAMPGPASDGGTWMSHFKKIEIQGFKGHGIYLEGGTNGLTPNQALIFELCNVTLNKLAAQSTCALKMTGQQGQVTFLNTGFNGYNNNNAYHKGHVVDISYGPTQRASISAVVSFINSTIQEGDYGLYIDYAENITVDNCWFENLGVAITVNGLAGNPSNGINIENNRFANAGGYGLLAVSDSPVVAAGAGRCVNIVNSRATIANNYVVVSGEVVSRYDNLSFVSVSSVGGVVNPGVEVFGNSFMDKRLNRTSGIVQVVTSITSGTVECAANKFLYVNGPATVSNISSSLVESEVVTIRANVGSITFNNQGNIFLTHRAELILTNGEVAQFTKIGTNLYQLTSLVTGSTP